MDRNTGAGRKIKVLRDSVGNLPNKTCNSMQVSGFYKQDHHGNQARALCIQEIP